MPIIPVIGRKTWKLRAVIWSVYAALILGSVTMVYPFLVMLAGSVGGGADEDSMDPVPPILRSEKARFARFQEARYGDLLMIAAAYGKPVLRFAEAAPPPPSQMRELPRFREFLRTESRRFPLHFYTVAEFTPSIKGVYPRNFRVFKEQSIRRCRTVEAFNRRYDAALTSWNDFLGAEDRLVVKEFSYDGTDRFVRSYLDFKRSAAERDRAIVNIDGFAAYYLRNSPLVKSGKLRPLTILAKTCPRGPERTLWLEVVRHGLNPMFVRLDAKGLALFGDQLKRKYPQGIARMNSINETRYSSFDSIRASDAELTRPAFFTLYSEFISTECPAERLIVDTPSTRYRAFIKSETARMPVIGHDFDTYRASKGSFLWEALTRNFISVIQYVAIHGRAIVNTVIYVGLSILAALLVNPVAAYALSRFRLRSTYTILMFFLATMAFPGAVTMIPNFLLLKQFHLLNTYWALILPSIANGYLIFILKGFFDSIPREVYESAQIDGAGEWTMFWRFTMALSKPILALITLGAFTAAYTAFMFALIICPDERMWTLMVWLYQMQQDAAQPVIYAALVLAAIPTLVVFVLAQNTIMKGIVIPVEK